MTKTLLFHSVDHDELAIMVEATLQDLKSNQLITNTPSGLKATLLGQAIVSSSLTPEDGLFVHREIRRALQAFVMDSEMHIIYAFTPVQSSSNAVNWQIFRRETEMLDESSLRVLEFVGLKPSVINKMYLPSQSM
jgi:hypothetical protein